MNTYSGVSFHDAASPAAGLAEWQSLMRRACDAARCGNTALAGHLYQQSLVIAQSLMTHGDGFNADDRLAAFVVTRLNLADLHNDLDEPQAAVAHLCGAHETLMGLVRDQAGDHDMQQAAFRHSRETHAALLAYLSEHGSHPAVLDALRAGCMPFPPARSHTLH